MATVRINKPNDATWARSWSVDDAAGRAALLATAGTPLGLARGDWIFQVDTSQWYVFAGGTTLLAIIDGSDVARLSQANVFTATPQRISANDPEFNLFDTAAAANSRLIGWQNSGGLLLVFKANDDGSGGAFLLTIDRDDGDLNLLGNITSFAGQIGFPATQNPSSGANDLDDYEEGTWTPVIGGSGGTSGQTYTLQSGQYTKIGDMVYVQCAVILSNKGTITTNVQIQGLPFTSAGSNAFAYSFAAYNSLATNWVHLVAALNPSTSAATILGAAAAATSDFAVPLTTADLNNTSTFVITFGYRAAA